MTVDEQIKTWVDKIPTSFPVTSIVDNGDGTSIIFVVDTAWTLINHPITIEGTEYIVESVIRDESITVKGTPIGTTYELSIPFFSYGTPTQANIERQLLSQNGTIVTPMIYLFASIREDIIHDSRSPIDKQINFVISFLNDYHQDQFTEDIIEYSVKAMRKLANYFVLTMKRNRSLVDEQNITQVTKEYPKYAQTFSKSGGVTNIFSENLSGVEVQLTVNLKKQSCGLKDVYAGGVTSINVPEDPAIEQRLTNLENEEHIIFNNLPQLP